MSVGIKNDTFDTTAITPTAPVLEEPQEGWTEEQRIAFIRQKLAETNRYGEESANLLKRSALVVFVVGKALDHEYKNRNNSEGAVGDWIKRNKLKWTPCREAMRLYWRCDTTEKRAELETLTITQAKRKYQCRYATFEKNRYKKAKPAGPVVDQLQDALNKLTAILDAAKPDDWHQAEDLIGTVSAQIADVMGKLSGVKKTIDDIVPVGQRPEPVKSKGRGQATAAETPEKTTRRRSKVGDDQ